MNEHEAMAGVIRRLASSPPESPLILQDKKKLETFASFYNEKMVNIQHVLAFLTLFGSAVSAPTQAGSSLFPAAQQIWNQAQSTYTQNTYALMASQNGSCTPDKVLIRRAWDDLTTDQRNAYIASVKCLYTIPSKTPKDLCPGCRTLLDDFVYAHINQTNYIHLSSLLLPWHRQFVWSYEQALRNQCGYTGPYPYWAWERYSTDQSQNPVFSADSFGGNGENVPHGPISKSIVDISPPSTSILDAGTGGGCVMNGPFANWTVNLGPVGSIPEPANDLYGTQYNPRCLTRDFYQPLSSNNLTFELLARVYQLQEMSQFDPTLQLTVHTLSHNFIGGIAIDFYTSVQDPVFFLLHGQVDRVWSIWQGGDYSYRSTSLYGTVTYNNTPPSPNGTLDTIMKMGVPAGGDMPVREAMLTTSNNYCYMYA